MSGVTGHNWEVIAKAVATGLFDNALCWYNCALRDAETTIFPEAQKHDTGVVIMQAARAQKLFGGEDQPPMANFYRYVLSNPAVNVTLKGMRDIDEFMAVAAAIAERDTVTEDEKQQLEAYGAMMLASGKLELE